MKIVFFQIWQFERFDEVLEILEEEFGQNVDEQMIMKYYYIVSQQQWFEQFSEEEYVVVFLGFFFCNKYIQCDSFLQF